MTPDRLQEIRQRLEKFIADHRGWFGHVTVLEGDATCLCPSCDLRDLLAALDTAHAEARRQVWESIETAEKYGAPIHVYAESFVDPDFNPTGCREACWQDEVGWLTAAWNPEHDIWSVVVAQPTHWRPMPAPPERAQSSPQTETTK